MTKKRLTDEEMADFIGRMQFLDTMWGCSTDYSIDLSTGRGWLKVSMPGNESVLMLESIDARRIFVIGRNTPPPSVET